MNKTGNPMHLFELIHYWFFKQRLKQKVKRLYELEDPWSSADLAPCFSDWIQNTMKKRAPTAQNLPILDLGGGEGHFFDACRTSVQSEYHLLDINSQALRRAKKRLQNQPLKIKTIPHAWDTFSIRNQSYGAIWIFSVLSYLGAKDHPRLFEKQLKKIRQALAPGGVILSIHPFYTHDELLFFQNCCRQLAGSDMSLNQREIQIGKQSFLISEISYPARNG